MTGYHWAGALIAAGAIVYAIYCLAIAVAFRIYDRWQARKARRQAKLRAELTAEAERIFPGTDSDKFPGCQCTVRWNGDADRGEITVCGQCAQPVGKHRAVWGPGSLDDETPAVVLAVVTEVMDRRGRR